MGFNDKINDNLSEMSDNEKKSALSILEKLTIRAAFDWQPREKWMTEDKPVGSRSGVGGMILNLPAIERANYYTRFYDHECLK